MKPILFNTEMVRAILDGHKTVTRRVCKIVINGTENVKHRRCYSIEYPSRNKNGDCSHFLDAQGHFAGSANQPYRPSDILYVRETWQYAFDLDGNEQIIDGTGRYLYAADNPAPFNDWLMPDGTHRDTMPWRPSIHMPKEAARLFLRVTDVRVERLQGIDDEGAKAEGANWRNGKNVGFEEKVRRSAIERFSEIWDRTVKPSDRDHYGWNANPWVWVIEFERISKEEALKGGGS